MRRKIKNSYLFKPQKKGGIHLFFLQYWWVLLFMAFSYGIYDQGIQKKNAFYEKLKSSVNRLESEKLSALYEKDDLLLRIESQTDPEWIRMILMKKLGVVPEGQIKVHFK